MYKMFETVINLITNKSIKVDLNNIYVIISSVIFILFVLVFCLRSITKKETRHPLFFNYAISGLGRKITIEKIFSQNVIYYRFVSQMFDNSRYV